MKVVMTVFVLSLALVAVQLNAGAQAQGATSDVPREVLSVTGEEYVVGRDDVVDIAIFEVPELNTTTRVTTNGLISVPSVGVISVIGKSAMEIKNEIEGQLRRTIKDPHVSVFVREYASQPVSVIGSVNSPSVYQIKGRKRLLDIIGMAHGLAPNAGTNIRVIRTTEHVDGPPETETITIDIEELLQEGRTELNIPIQANDIINVVEAGTVFVMGEVKQSGQFPLRNARSFTVTQALTLAGGFLPGAKKNNSMVIRVHRDGSRDEIPIDLQKVLEGSTPDMKMLANDILFIPASRVKTGVNRALESVISVAIGRAIYFR